MQANGISYYQAPKTTSQQDPTFHHAPPPTVRTHPSYWLAVATFFSGTGMSAPGASSYLRCQALRKPVADKVDAASFNSLNFDT